MNVSESTEQITVIQYCDWQGIPIFHIPNGGKRNAREAVNLKRQGVKAGVPDLFLPVAKGGYHGLFIEMKVGKNKPTENQIKWMSLLSEQGYAVSVCYGADKAIKAIQGYLKGAY